MRWDDNRLTWRGLDSGEGIKEIVMDLNIIAIAQHLPGNQSGFDQEAMDRSVVRAEKRRAFLYAIRFWCGAQAGVIGAYLNANTRIATPGRPG